MMSTIFSLLGLFIAMIDFEIDVLYVKEPLDPIKYPNAMDDPRNILKSQYILRILNMFTTIVSLIFLFFRHYYKRIWMNTFFKND
jgi:hypothetical protein